jgi:23S rRNA (adenine2503-C2)-methyltransferase
LGFNHPDFWSVMKPLPGELILTAPKKGLPPKHLVDMSLAERKTAFAEAGIPAYRADQVSRHWFGHLSDDSTEWTDIPDATASDIKEKFLPNLLTPVRNLDCDNGTTVKTVWRLHDGSLVESVLMRYPERITMCISSQAGCGMNCPFCATGQGGLTRNLSTAEIVEQVLAGARALKRGQVAGGEGRVSNVVFMGMGEPLANYERTLGAIRRLVQPNPEGIGISTRSVTVSTVGLVPKILQLAKEGMQLRLAVSLHAPDDELRDTLVPINTRHKVKDVLDAAWTYADATGRRVSIEYALIKDINDQAWRADMLGELLSRQLVHVNLIPLNPTPGSIWTASRAKDEKEFVRRLESHGVTVTVRDTRGREIDGACGQLAAVEK